MGKPTGARCNQSCTYCFYREKESLYPKSAFRMSDAVSDAWLEQLVSIYWDAPVVPVAWQGGEPTLMGLEFFRRAAARVKTLLRPGQRAELSLQTNGALLNDAWAAFLRQEHVLVGLSVDGPRAMHDAFRVDRSGRGTHARVLRAARLLRRHGVDTNAMVSVHAANAAHPLAVYRFLVDELDLRFIQLIPVVEPGPPISARTVDSEAWGRFLIAVFDHWIRHDVGRVFFPTFEAALAAWLGMEPALCVFAETCGDAVALEHNGDLYSCDHFVTPRHRLGNLLEVPLGVLAQSEVQRAFGKTKADLPGQCLRCDVRFVCRGECPKNRILQTQEGEEGLNWLCAGYKAFFTHIDPPMRLLARLVAAGLPAQNLMPLMRALERSP